MPKDSPDVPEAPENAKTWVSVAVAAAALGVSARTIRRRVQSGEISGRLESLEGGGRGWLVALESIESHSVRPSERPTVGTRADSVAKRPHGQPLEADETNVDNAPRANGQRGDKRTDTLGQVSARPHDQPNNVSAPSDFAGELVAHLKSENAFLRGVIEQLQRDGAETRAALRAALANQPKALVEGGKPQVQMAPEEATKKRKSARPSQPDTPRSEVTYASILAELDELFPELCES